MIELINVNPHCSSSVLRIDPAAYREEVPDDLKREMSAANASFSSEGTPPSPSLTFLGTGSSIPNKTRNVSAFLLENIPSPKTPASSSLLFDCGEGTLLQLTRFYGGENLDALNISAVYISHLHADHHLGLIAILKRWPGMTILAPRQIDYWLKLYSHCFEPIHYNLIPLHLFLPGNELFDIATTLPLLKSIRTCLVKHCVNAFAVRIQTNDDLTLTYSGDTMPCPELVELGAGTNVLVHEATMEDELKKEAVLKMHSTVSEAVDAGTKMNAKLTVLTHFSQRYAKVPLITNTQEKGNKMTVAVAFDNMRIPLDEQRLGSRVCISRMDKWFAQIFADDVEEMQGRTEKRRKKELLKADLILQQQQQQSNL
jgi:ribonuclease Z